MGLQVYASKKTLAVIAVIVIIGMVLMLFTMIRESCLSKSYTAVEATISSVEKTVNLGESSNKKKSIVKYVDYTYKLKGKTYTCKMRTFFIAGKTIGEHKTVYVDAEHPEIFKNNFVYECGGLLILFLGVFGAFCISSMVKK